MDWDWFVATFDNVTLLSKQFTKLDLALIASALSFIEDESNWETGLFDDIQAKMADIQVKIDDI